MYLSKNDINNLPRIERINLINSITGIKPANLIGSKSKKGISNIAIISSVVHLGSNPPLLAMIFRPQKEKQSDSYVNIKSTSAYTINHISPDFIEKAHNTSAKFPTEISEFDTCGFTEEYLFDFDAPFIKESKLKIGLELMDEIYIKANKTVMIIGKIIHLVIPNNTIDSDGNLDLEKSETVGIGGLNTYYKLSKISQLQYAHLKNVSKL